MIVRTYGRRNRPISRSYSDTLDDDSDDVVSNSYRDSLSQETSQDHLYGFAFSSQGSSSHWSAFDSEPCGANSRVPFEDLCNGVSRKAKRARNNKVEDCGVSFPLTSTLMEAQEFGEMMEHVDEVNFALDGLRKGQPVRIRRASLVSLLSICGTAHQRRLLRTQGMAKAIADAIFRLSLDDSPSNLAAATLLHILTSDGQDDRLLESSSCIRFLLKLLRPIVSTASEDRGPKLGSKLLGLRQKADIVKNTTSRLDSSSVEVFSRVEEILVNCKELKNTRGNDSGVERPELCPKWLALLTIEKACISAISLDETTGVVRKANGNFKEQLREHGGLDAVFEVVMGCYSDLENWMEGLSAKYFRNDKQLMSLTQLLKCLKIMENATFVSEDNQNHLLGMQGKLSPLAKSVFFTELVIRVVKILSDLKLHRSASSSKNSKSCNPFALAGHGSQLDLLTDLKGNETFSRNSSRNYIGLERATLDKKSNASRNRRLLTSSQLENSPSIYEIPSISVSDAYSVEMRVNSSTYGCCSGSSSSSDGKTSMAYNCSRKNASSIDGIPVVVLDDSQDPFAFDEDEFQPSKWDLMSGKKQCNKSKKRELSKTEFEEVRQSQTTVNHIESNNGDVSCFTSDVGDEELSSLLADCLHTAIKVLMNLSHDNPVGCRQIAVHGGLETMSSLIAGHFPYFSSTSLSFSQIRDNTSKGAISNPIEAHLTDHELDLLVAILGLLVNLVEKDSHNRSRLAASSITLPASEGSDLEAQRDVIQLLCSIFLANKGGNEGSGEDKDLQVIDEAALLEGEKEAEKMILEAYSALLLAFLSTESKSVREAIADNLPDRKLAILVPVLDRFVEFHLSLNMISPETHKAVSEVIESCRIP